MYVNVDLEYIYVIISIEFFSSCVFFKAEREPQVM